MGSIIILLEHNIMTDICIHHKIITSLINIHPYVATEFFLWWELLRSILKNFQICNRNIIDYTVTMLYVMSLQTTYFITGTLYLNPFIHLTYPQHPTYCPNPCLCTINIFLFQSAWLFQILLVSEITALIFSAWLNSHGNVVLGDTIVVVPPDFLL